MIVLFLYNLCIFVLYLSFKYFLHLSELFTLSLWLTLDLDFSIMHLIIFIFMVDTQYEMFYQL